MRLNQYLARATGISRRAADAAIAEQRVAINNLPAQLGQIVQENDKVTLDGLEVSTQTVTVIALHKPAGYVTSRRQQGNTPTVYALLPEDLQHLKPVGRLDKDTSGLLLLTNDGHLANTLTHPSNIKEKEYEVWLERPLTEAKLARLAGPGIELEDGPSRFKVTPADDHYRAILTEGRNRQIRRTFAALGNPVTKLHRTRFGNLPLGGLASGAWRDITGVLA